MSEFEEDPDRGRGLLTGHAIYPEAARDAGSKPLRFRILDLIVLTTVLAFAFAMIRALGYFAALVLFLVAAIVTAWPLPRWSRRSPASLAHTFDVTWGLLMPALCLALDPVFITGDRAFGQGDLFAGPSLRFAAHEIYWYSLPALAAIGWQMAFLSVLLVVWDHRPLPFGPEHWGLDSWLRG